MITLKKLPYAEDALAPHISEQTIQYHYHKHHQGYVDKLNKALAEPDCAFDESSTLEEIIAGAEGSLYNNAAQVWNHNFYWDCLSPDGGGQPGEQVADALTEAFGSVDNFLEEFKAAASSEFGSGWAWLVRNAAGKLEIVSTTDAENPLNNGKQPLLVLDVWEHAYYLDYQNARGEYLDAVCANLLNWAFLEKNLAGNNQAAA